MQMETLGSAIEEMMLVTEWHSASVAARSSAALNFYFTLLVVCQCKKWFGFVAPGERM